MKQPKIRFLGSSIVVVTIMVASLALPADATYPGTNGRILFGRFDYPDVGAYDLFTANPDGTHVVQVTHVPSYCIEWSPDGKKIAFTFLEPDGSTWVATMDTRWIQGQGDGRRRVSLVVARRIAACVRRCRGPKRTRVLHDVDGDERRWF